jgi:hypothetical protein
MSITRLAAAGLAAAFGTLAMPAAPASAAPMAPMTALQSGADSALVLVHGNHCNSEWSPRRGWHRHPCYVPPPPVYFEFGGRHRDRGWDGRRGDGRRGDWDGRRGDGRRGDGDGRGRRPWEEEGRRRN